MAEILSGAELKILLNNEIDALLKSTWREQFAYKKHIKQKRHSERPFAASIGERLNAAKNGL